MAHLQRLIVKYRVRLGLGTDRESGLGFQLFGFGLVFQMGPGLWGWSTREPGEGARDYPHPSNP